METGVERDHTHTGSGTETGKSASVSSLRFPDLARSLLVSLSVKVPVLIGWEEKGDGCSWTPRVRNQEDP